MGEPWIRVHAQLVDKPVVGRAAAALGISRHEAVGLLVTFWGAVSQLATNGAVQGYDDAQLEQWARWTRKRGKFASFIREHHMDDDGRVNEWDDYAGPLETRRQKDRDRKRRSRGQSTGSHADSPQDVTRTSALTRANDTKRDETKELLPPPAWRPAAEKALGERLPSDAGREALAAVLYRAASKATWTAECGAMLDGMPGHTLATAEQLEGALCEFAANGLAGEDGPNLAHFKSFVAKVVRRPVQAATATPGRVANASGRAALLLAEIRGLVQESQQPGQAQSRFIPKAGVAALGPDVLKAYDAIGGAERVLGATGEQNSFLARDFAAALDAAQEVSRASA